MLILNINQGMNIKSIPAASRKFYNVKRNCQGIYCGLWHFAMTEKTICCRELHNLSALYPYIISEHEIEC